MNKQSTLRRWLREPLLHFLALGAGLFALFGVVDDSVAPAPDRIVITQVDADRLATLFERRWQRPPTGTELNGLVDAHIREEILYREALALGLDDDDTIVRRRMAQKLQFLFEDLAAQDEPDDAALQAYLDANTERFIEPARVRFSHVYLNRDKRGAAVTADAERLLAELRTRGAPVSVQDLGDRFMLDTHYDADEKQIARLFGREFAAQVVDLPAGEWHGPVLSGYGLHLVYVESVVPPRLPVLDEIRDAVSQEVRSERQRDANDAFYENLRDRYEVVVENRPAAVPEPTAGKGT